MKRLPLPLSRPRAASLLALLAALTMLAPDAMAAQQACSKHSPAHTIALLELYTSEGCDSCPPANKFVSAFRSQSAPAAGLTADQVVPLSLHVDYWDYIGWKDVFAQRIFTERQRWLSNLAASRTIYTPEFFVAGKELRDWRSDVPATVRRINLRPAQASIDITAGQVVNGSLRVDVTAQSALSGKLYVALYENALTTDVRAGENRGVSLKHDYAVRDWSEPVALKGEIKGGKASISRSIAVPPAWLIKNLGVAAFVQSEQGEVLQALSLPLCGV